MIGSLRNTATSEVAVSPMKAVQSGASSLNLQPNSKGYVDMTANSTGTHYVYVPVGGACGGHYRVQYGYWVGVPVEYALPLPILRRLGVSSHAEA